VARAYPLSFNRIVAELGEPFIRPSFAIYFRPALPIHPSLFFEINAAEALELKNCFWGTEERDTMRLSWSSPKLFLAEADLMLDSTVYSSKASEPDGGNCVTPGASRN